ncbi:DUF1715-domain-containing protein [Ramaria rubella]|nr:DUF1715-domain-containing protein [Ramaria rubella]
MSLEDLLHVEQTFFNTGYTDGYVHGRMHGLIEGRALGQGKGYELWEEIGFYEGFAKVWEASFRLTKSITTATESRTENHLRHLLDLVSRFPRINPSTQSQSDNVEDVQMDVIALLRKIRARYKTLCAILGVKPRLLTAGAHTSITEDIPEVPDNRTRKKVWNLDAQASQAKPNEMRF